MDQPPKDPFGYAVLTYIWVIFISSMGGVVRYLRSTSDESQFRWFVFIKEIVISAFVGIVTFWFCEGAGFEPIFTAGLVAVSGHMGSRAIFVFENWFKERVGR